MARADRAPSLPTMVQSWLAQQQSDNTRAAYRSDVDHFTVWCETEDVDALTYGAAELARYRDDCELAGAGAPTVARRLSALASFRSFVGDDATAGPTPAARVPRVGHPSLSSTSTAEILSDEEARALLAAADGLAARSGVLVRLMMLDGLKVGEAVGADAENLVGRPPRMRLELHRASPRVVMLHAETAAAIRRYLRNRRTGPLLLTEQRGRPPARLTRFGIDHLVKQVAEAAGISQVVSGNTLRRRYVMAAHAAGAPMDEIRRNVGHVDARTTRRYLGPQEVAPPGAAGGDRRSRDQKTP